MHKQQTQNYQCAHISKFNIFCPHLGQIKAEIPGTPLSRLWKPAPCCRQACCTHTTCGQVGGQLVEGSPSGNYDTWDKWDKLGWVRISRISRIRLGYPHGTYPEKGVFILNIYPDGISYEISLCILVYPYLSYICIVYPVKISCTLSCNEILKDILSGYPIYQYIS